MHPMLNTAIKAARRAGTIINRASLDLDKVAVARKGPGDYVTEVDRACEEAIAEVLRTAYPDHAVLGEEFGLQGPEQADSQWIIDPLDGTSNFIHGFPHYAVSVALMQRGQMTQAVIYDPSRNELFTASRGGGAFLNDRRVRVSGRIRFHEALLGSHWPGSADADGGHSPRFRQMSEKALGVRRTGSTVLDLAYVACGRLDGYCAVGQKPWDLAAGSLLVLEAGGLIGDFDGEQTWLDHGNVIAGSPKIFTQMLTSMAPKEA
ncbi:inositol monophosphatase family protein [Schauerella aestuarii]|uniref:inositol monophosphatase family protein n=1 Tax=Schauerella aestuarii TaxID=2511204 RepID=UPI00136BCB3D|nr:inositol monophosphatase family protein [Achromobacter aestuarii]MYZ45694.1 inositol monophosphatase [Achromobacter aestuarii]